MGHLSVTIKRKAPNQLSVKVAGLDNVRPDKIIFNPGRPHSRQDLLQTLGHKAAVFFELPNAATINKTIKLGEGLAITTITTDKRYTLDII